MGAEECLSQLMIYEHKWLSRLGSRNICMSAVKSVEHSLEVWHSLAD